IEVICANARKQAHRRMNEGPQNPRTSEPQNPAVKIVVVKPPFLEALDERVLVCDGAMGTMLYSRGVFINRCFDSLNIMSPDTVMEVHQDYVRAGADVLETNTFG